MNRKILTFVVCLGLFSCSVKQSETTKLAIESHSDENFQLIDDFEKDKGIFRPDTFELNENSTDGGQLIAYHSQDKDYLVLDIWLFGETGKVHSTYWTDRKLKFKIIKRTDFVYDKPYYEEDYTVTETTEFYSYSDNSFIRYNSNKQEIDNSDNVDSEMKVKNFFADITKHIEIVK